MKLSLKRTRILFAQHRHLGELFRDVSGSATASLAWVDEDDDATDILVQPRHDQRAVERFSRHLLNGTETNPNIS